MSSTTTDILDGVSTTLAVKAPVRVATTANITLSGEQTIDGVAVVAGDRVLVKDQTDATENGIWKAATGAWSRAADFNGARDVVQGTAVLVTSGTLGGDYIFRLTTAAPEIGVSSLAFSAVAFALIASDELANIGVDDFADLAGLTYGALPGGVAAGNYVLVRSIGARYVVVASGGSGDLDYTGSGGVKLDVVAGPAGSTSFKAFGAVGDGTTNDAAAVQAALRSGIPIKNSRYDTFALSSAVTAPDVSTYVRGGVLKYTSASGNAISLHHTTAVTVDWDDVEIRTTQENTGRGLSISYSAAVLSANRHLKLVSLGDGVQIGGTAAETGAFAAGLYLDNVNNPDLGALHIRGRRNLGAAAGSEDREYLAGTKGIVVTSTDSSQPVLIDMGKVHVRAVETALSVTGAVEGLTIEGGQFINCGDGIAVDFTDLVSPPGDAQPGVFIRGVHVNAARKPIRIVNGYEVFIGGCELYRFSNVDGENFVGIDCDTVSEAQIHDNVISGANATGSPGTVAMMALDNFKRSRVVGNIGRNLDSGIAVTDAGSIYNQFDDNQAFNSSAKADFNTVTFSGSAVGTSNVVRCKGARLEANTAGVTVAATTTTIIALSIPDAIVGERYRVQAQVRITKGGTGGVTTLFIAQVGGTGTAAFAVGSSIDRRTPGNHSAGVIWREGIEGDVTITASGTVQLALRGTSAGSDGTVAASEGYISFERVR